MSSDTIKIEVDGIELEARAGQMLIEVTDAADIYVPRFCYHRHLSVAASCRMCLVEVEKAPKQLPACATPVTDGMKVFTKSQAAITAQKSVMEFLLINHPLDCPICDQGGECELQDIAMGYGRGISRYSERKRVVQDKTIGPLISTDMTRCILCTRCIRFGKEIAGIQELGTMGRGDRTEIGTFVEKNVDHELSGNIIDLCPVGALNNKPYRFSARAWEMVQLPTIAPHDCLGSNMNAHVVGGRVKRIVPRTHDALNETWLADRDRFSSEAIEADDRLSQPMVRDNNGLRESTWEEALDIAAEGLRRVGGNLSTLVSPSATTEEGYLLGRLVRHLGATNIDHRLRRQDFRNQDDDPLFPWLGMAIADVEKLDAICIIGSNLRKEVPLLAHRVRKASLAGAHVSFINTKRDEYLFDVNEYLVGADLVAELGALVKATADDSHGKIVAALRNADSAGIIIGQISMRHPNFAEIRALAAELSKLTGAQLGFISEGANGAGLSVAGVLPHRGIGGVAVESSGSTATDIVANPTQGLLLFGVEPEFDCADGAAGLRAVEAAEFVIACTPFMDATLEKQADVIFPIATFAETSGTFVNAGGDWQSFGGVAMPFGEARPGWKVLRVLGNLLNLPDCEYQTSESIRDELKAAVGEGRPDNHFSTEVPAAAAPQNSLEDLDIPMYQIDALVRRSQCLQLTRDGIVNGPDAADGRKIA
ncbi:MAG: NADH-quinone oxidoreductase subunit G [Gammaproteobacteria bacterium]|nr:MAG: NADH-quinone oxidoreductase subunit G [Gammaproteobacteria bacterium]